MNILLINNYHYIRGGAEKYYFELGELLLTKGHNAIYFSVKDLEITPSKYSKYFVEPISFEQSQSYWKKVKTAFKMLYSFGNRKKLKELLVDYHIDIAHAHNIYHRICPSVLDELKINNISIVMTLHDYKLCCPIYTLFRNGNICNECLKKGKFQIVKNKCNRNNKLLSVFHWCEAVFHELINIYEKNVSFFICPSRFSMRIHLEAGLPEKKLVYLPNYVNVMEYQPNYKCGDYILYVGRLSKEKGILTLLRVMKDLDFMLKVVGDGPLRKECELFVKEQDIKNVVFLGYKSAEEIKSIYRNAAFLIIPSEWYENMPMAILECFACGKPVLGSKIGGIPELIQDGQNGLLFEPGNKVDLREKISYLINNSSTVEKMGKKARERAEEEYSLDRHYDRLYKVYKSVLSK